MRDRFAPSPTGLLHLGHAFSALTAWDAARSTGSEFILRIEDIDQTRCKAEFDAAILDDLKWLGLAWPEPVMRQSQHMSAYCDALAALASLGVLYPCRCSRKDIAAALSAPQSVLPALPDSEPPYPGTCCKRSMAERTAADSLRLNMRTAIECLGGANAVGARSFMDFGLEQPGQYRLSPDDLIGSVGDVVLARKDIGTSYHLAVVVDDAAQGITHITRGVDLFSATPVQRILQDLLGLPEPIYRHHRLITDDTGQRLAKRHDAKSIRSYRLAGQSPDDLRAMLGLC